MRDLQELDAVASERGMVMGFRACEETEEFEPVFLSVEHTPVGSDDEVALIAITGRGEDGKVVARTTTELGVPDDRGRSQNAGALPLTTIAPGQYTLKVSVPDGAGALIAITDRNGMSLGRYVVGRSKLDAALADPHDSFAADCSSADRLV